MLCMLKNCFKCGGDLVLDGDEWKCIQCAQYYYGDRDVTNAAPQPVEKWKPVEASNGESLDQTPGRSRGDRCMTRSVRNLNSLIEAKTAGESRWRDRNLQVINHLDRGLSIQEISVRTGRGQREIRTVRERLADLRAGDTASASAD